MPGTPTPNLALVVPTIGSDTNIWGAELNANLATIDLLGVLPVTSPISNVTLTFGKPPVSLVLASGGAAGITVTLPTAVGNQGRGFIIKKTDAAAGAVSIAPQAGQTIDGLTVYNLVNLNQYAQVVSDGVAWWIVSNN